MVKDASGRVIDHLRLSVTDRCDQRCTYCMPEHGVEKVPRAHVLTIEEMVLVTRILVDSFGLTGVRLTGGEPLLRTGILDLTARLAALGIRDLALTTNGQRLPELAAPLASAGLARVNVSLDSLRADTYARLTRGGDLDRALAGIEAAIRAGLAPVKINTVVIRGANESEVASIARWAVERGVEARFLELMPVGVAAVEHAELFVSAREVRGSLAEGFAELRGPVDRTPTAVMYEVGTADGIRGRVGVIAPQTEPFCGLCGRLRLTTAGRLLPCLHDDEGVDLRSALRRARGPDLDEIAAGVGRAVAMKPACRNGSRKSPMHAVGG